MGTPAATEVQSDSANTDGTAGIPVDQPIINSVAPTAVTEPGPLDVIIQVYVKGTRISLGNAQNDVLNTANKLFDEYGENGTLRVYVANYNGTLGIVNGKKYATSKEEAAVLASNLPNCTTTEPPDYFDCVTSLVENYNNLDSKRPDTDTYHVFVDRSGIEINYSHEKAQSFIENTIKKVFVTNSSVNKALADYIDGYYRESASGYGDEVSEYIIKEHGSGNKDDDEKFDYPIMTATGWKRIELDDKIKPDYEVISERIRLGEDPREMYTSDYADTDKDGLLDLEEIQYLVKDKIFGKDIRVTWDKKGNVVLPTLAQVMQMKSGLSYIEEGIKELPLEYFGDFRILPIKSNPAEKDTDGDEFEDGEETLAERMKFSSVTIDDHLLDDSGSINGNNPEITEDDLDKMIGRGRVYSNLTNIESSDDSCKKNELVFKRTRKKDISDAKFTLTPSRNSDFAITITGTEELNLGEGATADDYNSTVRISYNKGNRKVDPVEKIRLSDYGTSITYVFALEAGTEYSIKVNNPTNNHEGEYDIHVSEDNWVYAPKGGYCRIVDDNTSSSSIISSLYIKDEYIYDMIKIYVNKDYKEGHGLYPNTLEEFLEKLADGMINGDVASDLADDMFRLSNISDNQTNEIIDFLSPSNIGNIASIAGLVVAFIPGAGEVGFICTVIGGGAAIASIDNSLAITEPTTDELKNIFIQGQLNMSIDTTSGTVPGESHEIYSTRYNAWEEKCYINKYYDPVRHLKKWDTFIIFTDLYEIEEKGGKYALIEKK